jgi:hypothetical protein
MLFVSALAFITIMAFSYSTGITGLTRKTGGIGCYCHGGAPSTNVSVLISGPDTVFAGDSVVYTLKVSGGPLIRAGTNIAAIRGALDTILLGGLRKISLELTHRIPKAPLGDSVSFQFLYRAPLTPGGDTLYANGNSVNFNNSTSGDQWNFAEDKIITILDPIGIINISSFAKDFSLNQNYPNPFNPKTNIIFTVGKASYIKLKVYDALGNELKVLVDEKLKRGEYSADFNAQNLSSGVYFYALYSDGIKVSTRKMILIK